MKHQAFVLSFVLSFGAYAQTGNYFLAHFSPDTERFNAVAFDMAQDARGLFYFATQRGVLRFDGRNWDLVRTHGAAYSLELAADGTLYVAGSKGFGKIDTSTTLQVYEPLDELPEAGYAFQVVTLGDSVYFLNDKHVFLYSKDSVTLLTSSPRDDWVGLNELFGKLFISTDEDSLLSLSGNHTSPTRLFKSDSSAIIFSERFEDKYLVGTSSSRIYLCETDLQPREILLADSVYANASVIVNATWINSELIVLGTLHGGVMFINPSTGATEEIINFNTGLPDNEIYSVIRDHNQNIWVAHAYGFTRIAPHLPFRSFRYYHGLQGNLLCAANHNGSVYVGTSLGLYRLEREEFYDEIVYFVDVPVRVKQTTKSRAPVVAPVSDPPKQESQKGGLFNFLRKKKGDKTNEPVAPATQPQTKSQSTETRIVYQKEKRIKKILRSSHFAYKKVTGIDSKVTQLAKWNGRLIASSLSGAYEVDQNTTRPIIEDPVRYLFASENTSDLIVSTNDAKLHRFTYEKDGWTEGKIIASINDPISYIFEARDSSLWLCGLDHVYRMKVDSVVTLPIDNSDFERMVGISEPNRILVASSNGFYFYDIFQRGFSKVDTLSRPRSYFASNSTLWFKDDHAWYAIGQSDQRNVALLNLFQEIRFMTKDEESGNLWIITGNNELIRFNIEQILPFETTYPLFLKYIEQDSSILTYKEFLRLDQENSSVRVEVIKPDYIGVRSVEYRYFLVGLHAEWTEWSADNNQMDFAYLPPGEYELKVQSKDIFGRTAEMDPLQIKVLPPYWKRSWFYALEFGVFTMLVILSFRLSYRYRFVSRVLSLLSIIILIEFIQTAAGSTFTTGSGPVVEFAVQVGIAFLILPVEGFLRRIMLRSIDKRGEYKLPESEEKLVTEEKKVT